MREYMKKCGICGETYDEDELIECQECGIRMCSSCQDSNIYGEPVCPVCWEVAKDEL